MGNVSKLGAGLLMIAFSGALISSFPATATADDGAVITPLPTPDGARNATAHGVNADGTIVGSGDYPRTAAVRWNTDGTVTTLAPLQGDGSKPLSARAINDAGVVVGTLVMPCCVGDTQYRATKWTPDGSPTELAPAETYNSSLGLGINADGIVVGESRSPTGLHATRWAADGTPTDLGVLQGDVRSRAFGINADGVMVGESWTDTVSHALRWAADGSISQLPVPAGSTGAGAGAINVSGVAVGWVNNATQFRAARWDSEGTFTDLGTLPGDHFSFANAINADGVIVGRSCGDAQWDHCVAVLWDADGKITALGSLPGHTLSEAKGINDDGLIVGYSSERAGFTEYAVTWTLA